VTTTQLRHATFPDLLTTLRDVEARKLDVVASGTALSMNDDGNLIVPGTGEAVIDENGVTPGDGTFAPLNTFEETAAPRLDIPLAYWRRCPAPLRAENVNHWLHADPDRKFLVRLLTGVDGMTGVARALLSNGYKRIDNLDVTMAMLDGVRSAGIDPSGITIDGDLTARRLQIRITAPSIAVHGGDLSKRYQHKAHAAKDRPMVWGGLVASNSETGGGAWSITPRIVQEICTNGMTRARDSVRSVHVGGKLAEGIIDWSEQTRQAEVDLIRGQARDAVMQFLSVDYVQSWVDELQELTTIKVDKPVDAVQIVARQLSFGEKAADEILAWFIDGADTSAWGLVQAVTAWAQDTDDVEAAIAAEAGALDAALVAVR
jgi:hypothetical protein